MYICAQAIKDMYICAQAIKNTASNVNAANHKLPRRCPPSLCTSTVHSALRNDMYRLRPHPAMCRSLPCKGLAVALHCFGLVARPCLHLCIVWTQHCSPLELTTVAHRLLTTYYASSYAMLWASAKCVTWKHLCAWSGLTIVAQPQGLKPLIQHSVTFAALAECRDPGPDLLSAYWRGISVHCLDSPL